jgi:hypothetical protein
MEIIIWRICDIINSIDKRLWNHQPVLFDAGMVTIDFRLHQTMRGEDHPAHVSTQSTCSACLSDRDGFWAKIPRLGIRNRGTHFSTPPAVWLLEKLRLLGAVTHAV